jgi:uncharacterized protein YbaR (Trm112 family)
LGVNIYLQKHPVMLACPVDETFRLLHVFRNEQQSRVRHALACIGGSDIP